MAQSTTLHSDHLDTSLVAYLSKKYLVVVWEEGGEIHYKLTPQNSEDND